MTIYSLKYQFLNIQTRSDHLKGTFFSLLPFVASSFKLNLILTTNNYIPNSFLFTVPEFVLLFFVLLFFSFFFWSSACNPNSDSNPNITNAKPKPDPNPYFIYYCTLVRVTSLLL